MAVVSYLTKFFLTLFNGGSLVELELGARWGLLREIIHAIALPEMVSNLGLTLKEVKVSQYLK